MTTSIHREHVEPTLAPRWVSEDVDRTEWPKRKPVLDVVAEHPRLILGAGRHAGSSAQSRDDEDVRVYDDP